MRHSWDCRGKEGWYVGTSLENYRCQRVVAANICAIQVSDTVEFLHHYLTQPTLTPGDHILHGLAQLTEALEDKPSSLTNEQLEDIAAFCDIFVKWAGNKPGPQPQKAIP